MPQAMRMLCGGARIYPLLSLKPDLLPPGCPLLLSCQQRNRFVQHLPCLIHTQPFSIRPTPGHHPQDLLTEPWRETWEGA